MLITTARGAFVDLEFPDTPLRNVCVHDRPHFGCAGCIWKDRTAAIEAYVRENSPAACPDHGLMTSAGGDRVAMTVTYECASWGCSSVAVAEVK